jgi:hypothetical protein
MEMYSTVPYRVDTLNVTSQVSLEKNPNEFDLSSVMHCTGQRSEKLKSICCSDKQHCMKEIPTIRVSRS